MSSHITPEEKKYLDILTRWSRMRYLNYASKKHMTYNQAINFLFRRPLADQVKELDSVVDPEYHSSQEPKQESLIIAR